MKQVLSIIRWKFVLPVSLLTAALIIFFVLFFDPLLARGIEVIGTKINGAKVEVSKLQTQLFKGRLQFGNIQVTNRQEPMRNMVEMGPLVFQLVPSELFKKRAIIPEATIDGVRLNTARKSSGAIPKKKKVEKESVAAALASKYSDRFKMNLGDMKFDAQKKIEFDPKNTHIVKAGQALKEKSNALPAEWENKIKTLNVEGRLKSIETDLKTVEETAKGGNSLTAVPQAIKQLGEVKDRLNQLKLDIQNTKDGVDQDVQSVRGGIRNLESAKKDDIDDILSKLNLDFLDPKRLSEGIVGPAVLAKIQTALGTLERVRKIMPSKKEKESLPPKPRQGGMTIPFPTPQAPPRFWLHKARLSGDIQGISLQGTIDHLNTDPPRVKKPTLFAMRGKQGGRQYLGELKMDHTGEVKKDGLVLEAKGLALKEMLADGPLSKAIQEGSAVGELILSAVGDQIDGRLNVSIEKLKWDSAELIGREKADSSNKLKANFIQHFTTSLNSLSALTVEAKISGTWKDPHLRLSTNLENELARVIKNSVGNIVQDQRREIEQKLNVLVKEQTSAVESQLSKAQAEASGSLNKAQSTVQEKISQVAGLNLGSSKEGAPGGFKVPSLDKLFKK